MGRIDPPGGLREVGTVVRGKLLLGVAAVLIIAIGAYELGKRSSAPPPRVPPSPVAAGPPATTSPPKAAVSAPPDSQSTDELLATFDRAHPSPREERATVEVTVAPPELAPETQPTRTVAVETPHDKMARCLTFRVETDEVHYGSYSPLLSPVKVTVTNGCSFSFEGPEVSVEVRAFPVHGEGSIARAVGQFQEPIPSRGSTETQMLLACPRCDNVTHRFEARLLP